jgi:hypothetical protein
VEALYAVTLTPLVIGEADLRVYDESCSLLCSSAQGSGVPDVCLALAARNFLNIAVEVRSTPFDVPYVLTVTPAGPSL